MAAGLTYEPIATTTLGSAGTVTFSSIPQTYTDLVVILAIAGVSSAGNDCGMQFNGDTTTNYTFTLMMGSGSSAVAYRFSSNRAIIDGGYSGIYNGSSNAIANIMNYSNTTTYKTTIARGNSAGLTGAETTATVSLWKNTAAINQVKVMLNGANFATGTVVSLYGIAAA